MEHLKFRFLRIILIVCFTCLYGCTSPPTVNDKNVTNNMYGKYRFDDINLTAKNTLNLHGNQSMLTIKFVNGINLPSDSDTSKITFAWKLGKQVIKAIDYPERYDSCTIDFDTRTVHGDTTNDSDYACTFAMAQMLKK